MTEINLFSISSNKVQPEGAYDAKIKCGEILISFKSFKFEFVCSLCQKAQKYKTFYDLYEHVTKEHNLYSEEVDRPVHVLTDTEKENIDDPLADDQIETKEVPPAATDDIKLEFDEYIEEDEEEVENDNLEEDIENDVAQEYKIAHEDGLTITRMEVCELPAVNSYTRDGKRFIPFGRHRPKIDHCSSPECKEKNPNKRQHILKLIDMYRKCIGLWHIKTAENTPSLVKTTVRKLMVMNSETKMSVAIMRLRLSRMTDCFNSSWQSNSGNNKPWFYEDMKFLQFVDFDEIPVEVFDDFKCPFCKDREVIAACTLTLWEHIVDEHKLVGNMILEEANELAMTWPTDHILEFINIYREQESLWNKKCKEYFNRPLKGEAYQIMLDKFNAIRPNVLKNRNDVKDIIRQLRIYFRRADKKYQVSNVLDKIENPGNDTEYVIYEKLIFLKDVIIPSHPRLNADFECDICNKTFAKKFLMHEHFKSKHKNSDFKCDKCPMAFESAVSLKTHQSTQHQDDGRIYNCPICHSEYSNLEDFDMHLYDHLPHKSLAEQTCSICDVTMSDRGNLLIHLRRHCDIKRYECDVCNERFITSTELRLHKIKHTSEKPYVCEVCGVGFKYRQLWVQHNMYHGQPTFNCDECDLKFYTRKHLVEHKKAHAYPDVPVGKIVCELCGALFGRTDSLTRHKVKMHNIKTRNLCYRSNVNKVK